MKPSHTFIVSANLPQRISALKELAYNYWWCWNADAKELFIRIDRMLWEEVNHNPVQMLNKLTSDQLQDLSTQAEFTSFLDYIYDKFTAYMQSQGWYDNTFASQKGQIAYFSTEYGINESFPNYSGGLGVLSGDHLKAASDLGLPLVGIGLLYQLGYFRQVLTQTGWQTEVYPINNFYTMPLVLVKDKNGDPVRVFIDMPNGRVYAQIWKLQIGKVPLFLLDTNITKNTSDEYRDITDQLYGGTRETRIQQEIILGIGGVRALTAMGLEPEVFHINEGHAAFALFERTRLFMEKYSIDFDAARQITRASSVFTTHTPVPAGNEVFRIDRMDIYFPDYHRLLGISREDFLSMGQMGAFNPDEGFSMTVLGLRLTSYHNGVSKLHGAVARDMWRKIWKVFPEDEVPIRHITNGIHTQTWVAREFAELFDRYLSPRWRTETDNPEIWKNINIIPSEELWREKQRRRVRLILFARDYLKNRQKAFLTPEQITKINDYLNPDALTIGFARRFATYKRALLLFKDMDRLSNILKNTQYPVQIIMAGKAHPHDTAGKEVIQSIIQKVRAYGLERHVVFLEDYDMVIARLMVKGCDIWLNTPIRPMEASGTSGMKAALNGTLNFSVLDGWWDEAYNGANGFAVGLGEEYPNVEGQEIIESGSLYDTLEQVIIPLFYDRTNISRIPDKWVQYMKECIKTIAPRFSTTRMIKEYTTKFYVPSLQNYKTFTEDKASKAVNLKKWKDAIHSEWNNVEIFEVSMKENGEPFVGKPIQVGATVNLGRLRPEDVVVQAYYGTVDPYGELINNNTVPLQLKSADGSIYHYEGSYPCPETGEQGFTVRVLPYHPLLVDSSELYVCAWAQ